MQQYLNRAQKQIRKYPTLYSILGKFDKFTSEKYDHNILLNMSSWSYEDKTKLKTISKITNSSDSIVKKMLRMNRVIETKYYLNILKELELLFRSDIDLNLFKKERREDIKAKMNSFDKDNNLGIFRELYLYLQLKRNTFVSDIVFDNIPKSNHDFRFKVNGTEFNSEVTSLGVSIVEKNILNSFKTVGDMYIAFIPKGSNIQLDVDIERIKHKTKGFEENHITKVLSDSIKLILSRNTLSQNLPNKRKEKKYPRNITIKDSLISTPIVGFTDFEAKKGTKCITFRIVGSEEKRINAKLHQLKLRVKQKLEFNQLRGQKNPLLILQFTDVFFHRYSDYNFVNNEFLNKLTPIINQSFSDLKKSSDILGVIFYEDNLKNGIFFGNPDIAIGKRTKSDLNLITRTIS